MQMENTASCKIIDELMTGIIASLKMEEAKKKGQFKRNQQ